MKRTIAAGLSAALLCALGKALEQLAQHLHEGRMVGVEHHADLPLLRLLHDEAV